MSSSIPASSSMPQTAQQDAMSPEQRKQRERHVFLAHLAEQSDRFEGMYS
jgi:hypothetical protein